MSKIRACPSPRELRRLALGELPPASADLLAQHVLACSHCAEQLDALNANDPLAADLPALRGAPPARDAAADALVAHLAQLSTNPRWSDDSAAAAPEDEPLPERVGRYRVVSRLGAGGFGTVLLAEDEHLGRRVAVKVPHRDRVTRPADAEAYIAEARNLAGLDHPHIVPVYDAGSTAEYPWYIVSKYVEGQNLAQYLAGKRVTPAAAAKLVAVLAEALHHAHLRGLVHRDVKPGNILLDGRGRPFLADFGLALREEDVGRGPRLAGTPAYMSPEQARGEAHLVDGRTDIYGLGVVLYELLSGRPPFRADTPSELLEQVATRDPRPLRQINEAIPRELERICLKALAKRPPDRHLTAQDFADELRRFLAPAAAPAAPRTPPPAPARRLVWLLPLLIAVVVIAASIGVLSAAWLLWPRTEETPPPHATGDTGKKSTPPLPISNVGNPPAPVDTPVTTPGGRWREFSDELPMLLAPEAGARKHADEPFLRLVEERLVEPFDAAELADVRAARLSAGVKTDPPFFLYLYTPHGVLPAGTRRGSVELPDELRGHVVWWATLIPRATGPTVRGVAENADRRGGKRSFAVVPAGEYRIVLAATPLTAACEKRLRADALPAFAVRFGD